MTERQRIWLSAASTRGGSFIKSFAEACFNADSDNFHLLLPVLEQMMIKYPNYLKD